MRPLHRSFRALPHWLAVGLCFVLSSACVGPADNEAADGYTSTPADASDGGATPVLPDTSINPPASSDGNAVAGGNGLPTDGNAGTGGNQTGSDGGGSVQPTEPSDPTVYAVDGGGFSLASVDYPGYCVAAGAQPAVGVPLGLAQCANVPSQSFTWYKGGLALLKQLCITSPTSVGGRATLQTCTSGAEQVWQLSGQNQALVHTVPDTAYTNQSIGLDNANLSVGRMVSLSTASNQRLKLKVANLPHAQGFRIYANRTDGSADCMTDSNGTLLAGACADRLNGQIWQFVGDQLQSAPGRCLIGTSNPVALRLGTCDASVPTPANQRWYIMDFYLSSMDPSTNYASGSLVIDYDATARSLRFVSPTPDPVMSIGAPAFF